MHPITYPYGAALATLNPGEKLATFGGLIVRKPSGSYVLIDDTWRRKSLYEVRDTARLVQEMTALSWRWWRIDGQPPH